MDCNLPGSSVHGNSPGKNTGLGCHAFLPGSTWCKDGTRILCVSHIGSPLPLAPPGKSLKSDLLEWVKVKVKSLSRVRLFATSQTVAYQVPPSMGFSRQGYWSGLSFPSPGIVSIQGSIPGLPHCRQFLTVWATRLNFRIYHVYTD